MCLGSRCGPKTLSTPAALIMTPVFMAFVASPSPVVMMFGIGLVTRA